MWYTRFLSENVGEFCDKQKNFTHLQIGEIPKPIFSF